MSTILIVCTTPDERAEMALQEARVLGYRCIFSGDKADEKILALAAACYEIDWENWESLLHIAKLEKVDGIVGLCDKAMIPVAKTCQALNLPCSSPESMNRLISKNKFREVQERAGVFYPKYFTATEPDKLEEKCASLCFPVIVKPVLCSSSFGQTVVYDIDGLKKAFPTAAASSRNHMVCVEEYVVSDSFRCIELDIFVMDGEILWDGTRESYRPEIAPLRPTYDVYPAVLTKEENAELQNTVSAILQEAGAVLGEYNIEGFFTREGKFFVIEINPRQAGYYNPQHIELFCGVNLTKLLLSTAMGDSSYFEELKTFSRLRKYMIAYSVFSEKAGILDHVHVAPELRRHLLEERFPLGEKNGCFVPDILTATRPISILVFEFASREDLEEMRLQLETMVYAVLAEQ